MSLNNKINWDLGWFWANWIVYGSFKNYVDKFWAFFEHLLTPLTFSTLWTLTKNRHFLTTYPSPLVNVVCERPLIIVVEFRDKRATGSWYMLTDKLYTNYFFIKIDLDWLKHLKGVYFFVFKVIFLCQKSAKFVYFFIDEYKVKRRTFISDTFWLFSFL